EAVRGADVLVVATEWPEFAKVDMTQVRKLIRGHRIVDARNLRDPAKVRAAGFDYVRNGRALAWAVRHGGGVSSGTGPLRAGGPRPGRPIRAPGAGRTPAPGRRTGPRPFPSPGRLRRRSRLPR